MSNITGEEGSFSSGNTGEEVHQENHLQQKQPQNHFHGSNSGVPSAASNSNNSSSQQQSQPQPQQPAVKKKRNLPGTPGNNFQSYYSLVSYIDVVSIYDFMEIQVYYFFIIIN